MSDTPGGPSEFLLHYYGYGWTFNQGTRDFEARIQHGANWEVRAPATLAVGPDGQAWVVIRPAQPQRQLAQASVSRPPIELSLRSAAPPVIRTERLWIEYYDLRGGPGVLLQQPNGDMEYVPRDPPQEIFTAVSLAETTVTHQPIEPDSPYTVEFILTNAIYDGLEMIPDPAATPPRQVLGRMAFDACGRRWTLDYLPAFGERKQAIRNRHVAALSTAVLTTEHVLGRDLDGLDEAVDAICWLLSVASGCAVADPIRHVLVADRLFHERFVPRLVPTGAHSNINYELIANDANGPLLKGFLEQACTTFTRLQRTLRLSEFAGWLLQMSTQSVLEPKLAIAVLALEAITTRWCMTQGDQPLSEQQVGAMGVQQKLNRMRRSGMQFIETDFTDALREDIRNPLLHTGTIPLMTAREKVEWSNQLYMLGFKILLKLLEYRGRHRDILHDYALVDAPQ